jgi:hypothetical protein
MEIVITALFCFRQLGGMSAQDIQMRRSDNGNLAQRNMNLYGVNCCTLRATISQMEDLILDTNQTACAGILDGLLEKTHKLVNNSSTGLAARDESSFDSPTGVSPSSPLRAFPNCSVSICATYHLYQANGKSTESLI